MYISSNRKSIASYTVAKGKEPERSYDIVLEMFLEFYSKKGAVLWEFGAET